MRILQIVLFVLCGLFAVSPWSSPPLALALGLVLALTIGQPFPGESRKASKYLLQAAVVGLGFGLDLGVVLKAGSEGFLFTLVTITLTLILGYLLGKWLQVERKTSLLISVGTAICGGSAIAAVGPVINANEEEMSVALGVIFILNSIALFLFPLIGHALSMSQDAFGLWSALAIHDTSSVVGAASTYGARALEVGTTVKLSRALWIIPISFGLAYLERRNSLKNTGTGPAEQTPRVKIPWFIGLFVLASFIRSFLHGYEGTLGALSSIAKALLSLTLFLIGASLSRKVLKSVGSRPLITAVILWFIVGVSTLLTLQLIHS